MSSKDICMIDHLEELKNAGVDSLKIEGRMKSIYYAAVVTRAYRKMIDSINGDKIENLEDYVNEIYKVSHREFSTGFYYGKDDIEMPTFKSYMREYKFLGSISAIIREKCENSRYCYMIDVKNQIRSTGEIEYIGPDLLYLKDSGFKLLDENYNCVEKTDHGKITYLLTDKKLDKGFIIREKA